MGEFDNFCAITGWRYMDWQSFAERISGEDECYSLWDEAHYSAGFVTRAPSKEVLQALEIYYTDDDEWATSRYVVATPFRTDENGNVVPLEMYWDRENKRWPEFDFNESNTTYIFDVTPGREPERGEYDHEIDGGTIVLTGVARSYGSYLINFCAFLILQHIIPGIEAHTFCRLAANADGSFQVFPQIDYGPAGRAIEESVRWENIGEMDDDLDGEDDDDIVKLSDEEAAPNLDDLHDQIWWLKLLTQKGKTDEEIIKDASMGRGNMWVYKHPGIFPTGEAADLCSSRPKKAKIEQTPIRPTALGSSMFSNIPTEVMEMIIGYLPPEDLHHLITSNSIFYRKFHANIDRYTYDWARRERPWYFPIGPIKCEGGDEELTDWYEGWAEGLDIDLEPGDEEAESNLPWFAYHLACQESPNMRSRRRIWEIVVQIKELLMKSTL